MKRQPARTTLADLQNHKGGWVWAYCNAGCGYRVPLATLDEARRIAINIAKLPELSKQSTSDQMG